ncbi:MAG: hypothetical protein EOO73_36515 [Myxococcales bacterium]|nr:MAG: hypothetical protein EOO73_36515 [Myxococcales bacterium]
MSEAPDADLEALPPPRRPWRKLTLVVMASTLLGSLVLAASLSGEVRFSVSSQHPRGVGELSGFAPRSGDENTWVQGEGELEVKGAIAYRRPLESDSYRLSRVQGTEKLWVQVRVPRDDDDPSHKRFVPPASFVGRLVPAEGGGIRLSQLGSAIAEAGGRPLPPDAWLLIDGEAPATTRWTLGVLVLLLGFAAFNLVGLLRLLRPAAS